MFRIGLPNLFKIKLRKKPRIYAKDGGPITRLEPEPVSGAEEDHSLILGLQYYQNGSLDKNFWKITDANVLLAKHQGRRFGWWPPYKDSSKINTDAARKELKHAIDGTKFKFVIFEAGLFRSWGPGQCLLDLILVKYVLYKRKPSVLLHELGAFSMSLGFCIDDKSNFQTIELSTDSKHAILLIKSHFVNLTEEEDKRVQDFMGQERVDDQSEILKVAKQVADDLKKHYKANSANYDRFIKFCPREGNFSADCCTNFYYDLEMFGEIRLSKEGDRKVNSITRVSNSLRTILDKDQKKGYILFPKPPYQYQSYHTSSRDELDDRVTPKLVMEDERNELKKDASDDSSMDDQLESAKGKLHVAGKESAQLQRELHGLKQQHNSGQHISEDVAEALQPYEQNYFHELFKEMLRAAPALRGLLKMKKREGEDVNGRT